MTDGNVSDLYGTRVGNLLQQSGWSVSKKVLQPGEESKSDATLSDLYNWALDLVVDRKTPVVALGGGVVGDVAGYFAATLLRGLPLVHIPTTLVAQVDSSIGGKTGINHPMGKNLIGSFYRPRLVHSDAAFLSTLPDREWLSGLAETIKHALIADSHLFEAIEADWPAIVGRNREIGALIRRSAQVKINTVIEDEYESGPRMLLNFGHTFGHAIEQITGYGEVGHGQAVAIGMIAASVLSEAFSTDVPVARIASIVGKLVPDGWRHIEGPDLVEAMRSDKKRSDEGLRVILLESIGRARVRSGVDEHAIADAFEFAKDICTR